ncbi:zinc transporter ZntB [Lentibacter algarum]|uniref:zinc transporter ZntB n=1 Tax=Lentibacter algarum TaxID=576131 RepID=UPI001C07B8A7|nr:zinc transporter ZntB [Lentibacter algarum]MBU2982048.1 zinc transporter ZntB [Lentibacter algarum]
MDTPAAKPQMIQSFGFAVSKAGKAVPIEVEPAGDLKAVPAGGYRWIHLQGSLEALGEAVESHELDDITRSALTAGETRPRCSAHGDGAIIVLRGVNLNNGAAPDDMISLRIWAEKDRIISCGIRPLKALEDVVAMLRSDRAPRSGAELIAAFALRLADRAEPVVADLNEAVDSIEEVIASEDTGDARRLLADVRRSAISLRRYMLPQRDALTTFEVEGFAWVTKDSRSYLREAIDRIMRLCEELDSIRDRTQVVHDQVSDARAERMNNQMFVLTIVSAFFLPIGFVTGLLGINVGGLPLAENPFGFWLTCGGLVAVLLAEYLLFKKMKLF